MPHHRTIAPQDILLVQHRPAWKEQAFLRFAQIPHRVENCAYPFAAGDSKTVLTAEEKLKAAKTQPPFDSVDITAGDLPKIFDRRNVASSAHTISYMSSHLCNLDADLNAQQVAQVYAFTTLVERTLNAILIQSRWVGWTGTDWNRTDACTQASTNDITEVMRPHRIFPLNHVVAWVERSKAQWVVHQNRMPCAALSQQNLYDGYRALETMLYSSSGGNGGGNSGNGRRRNNDGPYMFGRSTPCSLDAIVYGHVATAVSERISGYGKIIQEDFPLLWGHYQCVCDTYFARGMLANENNSFYRLSLIAKERIEHNRVEKEAKDKRAKQEQKEGTENTSPSPDDRTTKETDVELGKPAFTGVNVRHNGGGNHMYLPKAERTRNQIGVFSGRVPSKPKKAKKKKASDMDEDTKDEKKSEAQLKQDLQNKYFLGFCGASVVGYLIWSGRIVFSDVDEY